MPIPADVFEKMPERFLPNQAGDINATYLFDLSGADGGQWVVHIVDRTCNVRTGTADNPTTTLRMKAKDYVDLALGDLDPMVAFMRGKVKIKGDYLALLQFQKMFVNS